MAIIVIIAGLLAICTVFIAVTCYFGQCAWLFHPPLRADERLIPGESYTAGTLSIRHTGIGPRNGVVLNLILGKRSLSLCEMKQNVCTIPLKCITAISREHLAQVLSRIDGGLPVRDARTVERLRRLVKQPYDTDPDDFFRFLVIEWVNESGVPESVVMMFSGGKRARIHRLVRAYEALKEARANSL